MARPIDLVMIASDSTLSPAVRSGLRLLVMLQASIAVHVAVFSLLEFGAVEAGRPPTQTLQVRLAPIAADSAQPVLLKAIDRPVRSDVQDWIPPAPETPAPPAAAPAQSAPEPYRPGMPAEAAGPTTVDAPLALDPTYYSAKEVDQHPLLVRGGKPIYPEQAANADVKGEVTILFLLNENGGVDEASVIEVKPPGYGFEEAVVQWLKNARFKPAQRKGRSVKSRVVYRVHFDPQ